MAPRNRWRSALLYTVARTYVSETWDNFGDNRVTAARSDELVPDTYKVIDQAGW